MGENSHSHPYLRKITLRWRTLVNRKRVSKAPVHGRILHCPTPGGRKIPIFTGETVEQYLTNSKSMTSAYILHGNTNPVNL
jgi:hypothetical protein